MAATRLISIHVNKGKSVTKYLADRTDYSQNAAKTVCLLKEKGVGRRTFLKMSGKSVNDIYLFRIFM